MPKFKLGDTVRVVSHNRYVHGARKLTKVHARTGNFLVLVDGSLRQFRDDGYATGYRPDRLMHDGSEELAGVQAENVRGGLAMDVRDALRALRVEQMTPPELRSLLAVLATLPKKQES